MNVSEKNSKKLKMKHVETKPDNSDPSDDNSDPSDDKSLRLCTKNVNGQMYLVMEPENENSVLSDVSIENDIASSIISDISMETDTAEEEDSELSVVLLNDSKSNENNVSDHRSLNQALTVPTSAPVVLPTISPSVLTDPTNNSNIISPLPSGLGENVLVNGISSLNATVPFPVDSIPLLTANIKKEPEIEPTISALASSSHSLSIKGLPVVTISHAVNTNSGISAIKSKFVNSAKLPAVNTLCHADGSVDTSGKVSVPISSPTGQKFTIDVSKTTNSTMLPKNIIVKSSQPLSQTNLKNILYSYNTILNVVSQSSTETSGNVAPKVTHTVLVNGTSTVYSALEPNMSSCVSSNSTPSTFSPKSVSSSTSTLAKTTINTENQPKISPLPIPNSPKKVFVVPVSLPSNNSQIVQLSMVSAPQETPVPPAMTSFKYVLNASSIAPVQQSSENSSVIATPTFLVANQATNTMSTTSSAFPLQTSPFGSAVNNCNQMPSQMTPCVLLSTLVDQTSPTVTTDEKKILHKGYVSSNFFQAVKSSNSSVCANVPTQSNNLKETVIKSSEVNLPNAVTTTAETHTTNLAVLEDFDPGSRKSSQAVTKTILSYNLKKRICTIPKLNFTAGGSCMIKTEQTFRPILPASTSDGRKSPTVKTATTEQNLQEVSSSTTANNLMDSIPESEDNVKDSSSTNLASKMKNTLNIPNVKKLFPRLLAPKTEISAVNSSTANNSPSNSSKDSNSLKSTSNSSKTKQTSSSSLPPQNSTTSVSHSSNFSKPMVFIGPINPDDLLNLAKHIPSAAQSVFQTSPKASSESVKIIHPNDIYKAKCNADVPKTSSTPQKFILVPPSALPDQVNIAPVSSSVKSKIIDSLLSKSTDKQTNTNMVKGLSLLYTSAGTAKFQSTPAGIHNNVPIIFAPSPKSSSSGPLKLNITTQAGSIYSQSHLKPSPAVVSTTSSSISKQQQQQAASVNIRPRILVKQKLPDSTVRNVAPIVSMVNSQENVAANPLVKLTSFSNTQVNLKLGKFSNASDSTAKTVSTHVVSYVKDPKTSLPQFVKLTKIVDNVKKMVQSPSLTTQPNQPEQLFFKVQQPETQIMQVVDPSQQGIVSKPAVCHTCENTKNVKSTTGLTSNILIPSTSTLTLPDQLTNSKSSNALHISVNNSSVKSASTLISDSQSTLGNLKSICQKEEENPMTLKIDSIFSLRDNSNFTINTPKDNWKINSEEKTTKDLLKPVVSSLVNSKPVVSSLINSKPVMSSLVQSKPVVSSLVQSKPVVSSLVNSKPVVTSWTTSSSNTSRVVVTSFTTSKPMVSSVNTLKPMITTMNTLKPVVSPFTTPKVMLTSLTNSKPMVNSLFTPKPVVSSLTTSTPRVTALTNFKPLVSIFPRPRPLVSIIPNSSRPVVSLFTNSQPTLTSLTNPAVSFATTSKPIISSKPSKIILLSNLPSTNSTHTPSEVNSTHTPSEVNSTETPSEEYSTETPSEENSDQTTSEENSAETPSEENSSQTAYKVNSTQTAVISTQTAYGEISTQTDCGENSTQTDYGENSTQTNYGENSCQTDYDLNSTQTDYDVNSTQTDYEVDSSEIQNEINLTRTPYKVDSKHKPDSKQSVYKINLKQQPSSEVNPKQPVYEINLKQPVYTVNSTQPVYEISSTQPVYKLNSTQPGFKIVSTQSAYKLNSAQPTFKILATQPTYKVNPIQPAIKILSTQSACKVNLTQPAYGVNFPQTAGGINSTQGAYSVNSKFSVNMADSEEYLSRGILKTKFKMKSRQWNKALSSKPPVSNSYRRYSYLNPKPIKPKILLDPNMEKLVRLRRENKYLDKKLSKYSEVFKGKKKTRLKINFSLDKFPIKQCSVMLPKLYLPDGQKSANVRKLSEKTLTSIRCTTCKYAIKALRLNKQSDLQTGSKTSFRYVNIPVNTNDTGINNFKQNTVMLNQNTVKVISKPLILPKATFLPNQRLIMMQINGKNVLVPIINKFQHQQGTTLNKGQTFQISIPTPLSPVGRSMAVRTSMSNQSLKTGSRFVNIAPNVVSAAPSWDSLTNANNLLNVNNPDYVEPVTPSDTSFDDDDDDNDDTNSCLQLACGIIETNTLKRKSSDSRRESRKQKDIIEMKNKKSKNYISSMLNI